MRIQPPLPDGSVRCLDSLVDNGDIDYATYLTIQLYADRDVASSILVHDTHAWRGQCSKQLIDLRDELFLRLPTSRIRLLAYYAAMQYARIAIDLSQVMASWALEDMTTGGALEDFKPRPILRSDGSLTPKVSRKLHSTRWIHRYVKGNRESRDRRSVFLRLRPHIKGCHDFDPKYEWDALQQDIIAQSILRPPQEVIPPKVKLKPGIYARNRRNRVAIKSYKIASSLLPRHLVSRFVNREEVRLLGVEVDLGIKLRYSIYHKGHAACEVKLYTKVGLHLADICVYFEDTPALDQLVAFALHMLSGEERGLIGEANITRVSPAGLAHPLLHDRIRRDPDPRRSGSRRESIYWESTKNVWQDTTLGFILGMRHAAAFREFLERQSAAETLDDVRLR